MELLIQALLCFLQILPLTGYLSGGVAFPKSLTPREEQELVCRFENGDEEARCQLIERNLRLVAHIAKKYVGGTREIDDLISIGTIGLIKAVNTYNRHTGKPLGIYAARCIENEILMSIRAEKKTRACVPLEEIIGTDKNGNEILLSALLGTEPDEVECCAEMAIAAQQLSQVLPNALTARERLIIEMRYGICGNRFFTQKEVAERFGISRSYVSRIEKKALQKLAEAMNYKE